MEITQMVTSLATSVAVIVATVALFMNYKIYKSRIAFDSLATLHEIFQIGLRDDRDKVVDVNISNDRELDEHIKKIKVKNDRKEKEIERSILRVLNFYALIGMMTQNHYLSKGIAVKHFGGAICHKVEDWKAFIENLSEDENYKKMIGHVQYIFDRCQ